MTSSLARVIGGEKPAAFEVLLGTLGVADRLQLTLLDVDAQLALIVDAGDAPNGADVEAIARVAAIARRMLLTIAADANALFAATRVAPVDEQVPA